MRCASSAAASTTSAAGLSAAAIHRGAGDALAARRADPRARRRLQPVPDRAAAGPAPGRPRRDIVDRGDRRADLQALHRDHAQPAGALRHRGAARGLAALHDPGRQPLPLAGRHPRRGRRLLGQLFHRARRDRRAATAPCASRAWAPIRSRATSASSTRPRQMGAQVDGGANWLEVSRGAWPLKAIDLDCNHIPDAAMTLAVMALYADGPTHAAQHRQLARQGNRPHRRHGDRAAQARRRRSRKAPTSCACTPPAALAAGQPSTPTTTTASRCASRWPPSTRPALPVRILDPKCVAKTFPDYFETLFSVARTRRRRMPVICVDGPTASGKGTLALDVAHRLGYHYLDSGALYRITGLAPRRAGAGAGRRPRAQHRQAGRDACRCASTAARCCWPARTSPTRIRTEDGRHERLARCPPCPPCARRWWRCSRASAGCRAWWPTAATWAR